MNIRNYNTEVNNPENRLNALDYPLSSKTFETLILPPYFCHPCHYIKE